MDQTEDVMFDLSMLVLIVVSVLGCIAYAGLCRRI
jgi:hypothetical protein